MCIFIFKNYYVSIGYIKFNYIYHICFSWLYYLQHILQFLIKWISNMHWEYRAGYYRHVLTAWSHWQLHVLGFFLGNLINWYIYIYLSLFKINMNNYVVFVLKKILLNFLRNYILVKLKHKVDDSLFLTHI